MTIPTSKSAQRGVLEFVNQDEVSAAHNRAIQDWDRSHFRLTIDKARHKSSGAFKSDLTPAERIVRRLTSYEARVSAPVYRVSTSPIPSVPLSTQEQLSRNDESTTNGKKMPRIDRVDNALRL